MDVTTNQQYEPTFRVSTVGPNKEPIIEKLEDERDQTTTTGRAVADAGDHPEIPLDQLMQGLD